MLEQSVAHRPAVLHETGTLVFKKHCYALRCRDGAEYWLEMDRSPCHLLDEEVVVEGTHFPPNIISVDRIRPM